MSAVRWPRRSRRWLLIACIVLWAGAFTATHTPAPHLPDLPDIKDTTMHAVGYLVLAGMFALVLASRGLPGVARVTIVLCVLLSYAALDELTQPYFNRTADINDWLADSIGTIIAAAAVETVLAITRRRRRQVWRRFG